MNCTTITNTSFLGIDTSEEFSLHFPQTNSIPTTFSSQMLLIQPLPKSVTTHDFSHTFKMHWVRLTELTLPVLHLQKNVQLRVIGKDSLLRIVLWLVGLISNSFMFLVVGRAQQQIHSFSMMLVTRAFLCPKGNTI